MSTRRWRVGWVGEAMRTDMRSLKGREVKPRTATYQSRSSAEDAMRFLVEYRKTSVAPTLTDMSAEEAPVHMGGEPRPHREPYVGEGIDGCLRSARIDREEADCLDLSDPRYYKVIASAESWERQAEQLAYQAAAVRRPEAERRGPAAHGGPSAAPER